MNAQTFAASLLLSVAAVSAQAAPTALYPQPNPSNAEQFMLERINVARANPAAEGQMLAHVQDSEILRYYGHYNVDTGKLVSDFAKIAARPPLAFNAKLMASSRQHSLDQASAGFQGHDGSDGSHFDQRITGQGYAWGAWARTCSPTPRTPSSATWGSTPTGACPRSITAPTS